VGHLLPDDHPGASCSLRSHHLRFAGEKFDHIALLTTFFITPLVFVARLHVNAVLAALARTISMFNPMFYMINAFRYSYTLRGDARS